MTGINFATLDTCRGTGGTNSFDLGAMAQDNTITLGGVIWSFCITTEELSLILAFGSMIQDKV